MEIIIDFTEAPDSLLRGTVRPAEGAPRLTFSGRMELLARLEELCLPADGPSTTLSANDPTVKGTVQ
jgi:hypothetical protein